MNNTELVIDRSSRTTPGITTSGKGTILWIMNWFIGSMAAIASSSVLVLIHVNGVSQRLRRRRFRAHAQRCPHSRVHRHPEPDQQPANQAEGACMDEQVEGPAQ